MESLAHGVVVFAQHDMVLAAGWLFELRYITKKIRPTINPMTRTATATIFQFEVDFDALPKSAIVF